MAPICRLLTVDFECQEFLQCFPKLGSDDPILMVTD